MMGYCVCQSKSICLRFLLIDLAMSMRRNEVRLVGVFEVLDKHASAKDTPATGC